MEGRNGVDYWQNYDFVVKWIADALKGETLDANGIPDADITHANLEYAVTIHRACTGRCI